MAHSTASPPAADVICEAARYALLRRLASAIRHDMMAHLQPIAMSGEVLQRRLAQPQPDLDQLRESVGRMTGFSRGAVQSCLDVITWLAPEPARVVPAQSVLLETLELLRSSFGFRGFVLREGSADAPWPVLRAGLRLLLPACLFLLCDDAGPPADVGISATLQGAQVCIALVLEPGQGDTAMPAEPSYRPLTRDEVQALAHAEGLGFSLEGDRIELLVPLAVSQT